MNIQEREESERVMLPPVEDSRRCRFKKMLGAPIGHSNLEPESQSPDFRGANEHSPVSKHQGAKPQRINQTNNPKGVLRANSKLPERFS